MAKPGRRVLHLAPMLQSGAGRMIVELAQELRGHGFACEVISSGETSRLHDWPQLVKKLGLAGIAYEQINFFDRDPKILQDSANRLAKRLREVRYDVIHAHSGVPAAAAHSALERLDCRIPVVATFYSWGIGRPRWMDTVDTQAFSRCNRMIVISSWYRDFLERKGIELERIEMIPPGIDPALFEIRGGRALLEEACGFEHSENPILADLAVIERRKNQLAAIEALALLPSEAGCRLAFIGALKDKEYHAELVGAARRLGVNRQVAFTGEVDDPLPLLAGADLFVFPSLSEGLGIAIMEAMALGVPVVSTAVEGATDLIIDGETAIAVDPSDPRQIAVAIGRMLESSDLAARLAGAARLMILKRYVRTRTTERCADLYRQVLRESGGG